MSDLGRRAARPQGGEARLFLYLIKNVQMKSSQRLGAALESFGVTAIQFRILAEINHRKNVSSAGLSRLFVVPPQTMNKQITQLETLGLVRRAASAENRRVLEMTLTAAGRRTLNKCREEALKLETELFRAFPRQRLEEFRVSLLELLRRMD